MEWLTGVVEWVADNAEKAWEALKSIPRIIIFK